MLRCDYVRHLVKPSRGTSGASTLATQDKLDKTLQTKQNKNTPLTRQRELIIRENKARVLRVFSTVSVNNSHYTN